MKDITTLIKFDEDEKILGIFEDEKEYQISIDRLNKKYHTLDDLPKSIFTITPEFISYRITHVFTNKRYIALGINFWQEYDIYCLENREKMEISNFTLNIPREELQPIKILFDWFPSFCNTYFFNDFVELKCFTDKRYKLIKSFLNEKWNIPASEIEKEENRVSLNSKKSMRVLNIIQYLLIFPFFYAFSYKYYNNIGNHTANLIFLILFSLSTILTMFETLYLYIPSKSSRLMVFGLFRVWFFLLPVLILFEIVMSLVFLF